MTSAAPVVPLPLLNRRVEALRHMLAALTLLDADGPSLAASTLSLAIEQAGGSPPPPEGVDLGVID